MPEAGRDDRSSAEGIGRDIPHSISIDPKFLSKTWFGAGRGRFVRRGVLA
jgi:hypothetical protein